MHKEHLSNYLQISEKSRKRKLLADEFTHETKTVTYKLKPDENMSLPMNHIILRNKFQIHLHPFFLAIVFFDHFNSIPLVYSHFSFSVHYFKNRLVS